MKRFVAYLIFVLIMFPLLWANAADIPFIMNYQGSVKTSGGTPYNGNGYFKFAFVNSTSIADPPTYWSNDDTSISGSEPTDAVTIPVSNGLFSVKFGDNSFTNMTTLQSTVFDESYMSVRTWFSDDNATFTELSPDQRIVSGAYAVKAQSAETAVSKAGDTMTGGLTLPSLTYSTPKVGSVTYTAMAFTPIDETTDISKNAGNGFTYIGTGSGYLFESITLPAGVTITGIECNCHDSSATARVDVLLKRGRWPLSMQTIATLSTTNVATPGSITLSDLTLNEVIAAGSQNFYFIHTYISTASGSLGFFSVTIHYTYTSP